MKNRKYAYLLLGLIMFLTIVSGSVLAYMYKVTDEIDNKFNLPVVSCVIEESFDGTNKNDIKVKNTGDINAYLRVTLVSYWVKKNGSNYDIVGEPSEMPSFELTEGWVKSDSSYTYYYMDPIEPENYTPNLIKQGTTMSLKAEGEYLQVVDVFAEAIQALGTTDVGDIPAVTDAWGVTLDSSGSIVSAP